MNIQILKEKDKEHLILQAKEAMSKSYSPYSNNAVGASILTHSGGIYKGANIGNSCSTLNCCAEQVALSNAVMNDDKDFVAIAVVQSSGEFCFPCGRCLQLLSEFALDMTILSTDGKNIKENSLRFLLPHPYRRP